MAVVTGRPIPHGGLTYRPAIRALDATPHPSQNIPKRAVQPYNYSPLGPSTRHLASPLKNPKVR